MKVDQVKWDDLRFFLEVARTRTATGGARRLGLDYTTMARRVCALEQALGALPFEKSRAAGFVLTVEGQRLLGHAETLESTLQAACEEVSGTRLGLSGHVRIGCTEGFGSCFVTAQMSRFLERYPHISVDILPVKKPWKAGRAANGQALPRHTVQFRQTVSHLPVAMPAMSYTADSAPKFSRRRRPESKAWSITWGTGRAHETQA